MSHNGAQLTMVNSKETTGNVGDASSVWLPETERSGLLGQGCLSLVMKPAQPSVLQTSLLSAASDPNILFV